MARRLARLVALCALVVFTVAATAAWFVVRSNRLDDIDTALSEKLDLQTNNLQEDADSDSASVPLIDDLHSTAWSYFIESGEARSWTYVPDARSRAAVDTRVESGDTGPWTERLAFVPDKEHADASVPGPGEWRVSWRPTNDDDEYVVYATDLGPFRRGLTRFAVLLGAMTLVAALAVGLLTWWSVRRALRPVEAIRERAELVTAHQLDGRVPVPERDDEIRRLALSTNDLLDRLDTAQQAQRRLIADASHELRNPMASLIAQLETGLPALPELADQRMATTALASARRVQRLVDDLLVLARGDEGTLVLARSLADIDELALIVAQTARPTSTVEIDTSMVSAAAAEVDPHRITQVITNLVANACRAAQSVVQIIVREDGADALIIVDDDGPGIDPVDRERIFERFVRLEPARDREAGGSGLGLSICRELVSAHGGTIAVTNGPLGGARFEVRVPQRRIA